MERDKGSSCLSLIFTEPARGGGSHPDLRAGKGPGNSLEMCPRLVAIQGGWKKTMEGFTILGGQKFGMFGSKATSNFRN